MGVTCCTHRVCRGTNARCRVPKFCSGVYGFFDEFEKTIHPTRIGSVRETDPLTHPQVTPTERYPGGGYGTALLRHTPHPLTSDNTRFG
jgi:hypothetical protein